MYLAQFFVNVSMHSQPQSVSFFHGPPETGETVLAYTTCFNFNCRLYSTVLLHLARDDKYDKYKMRFTLAMSCVAVACSCFFHDLKNFTSLWPRIDCWTAVEGFGH